MNRDDVREVFMRAEMSPSYVANGAGATNVWVDQPLTVKQLRRVMDALCLGDEDVEICGDEIGVARIDILGLEVEP